MRILYIINNLLAIALLFLRISPLLLSLLIITILYAAALIFNVVYIQSIGSGIGTTSEVAFCAGLIVSTQNPKVKLNRLTKAERLEFSLTGELKSILIGLILGDLFISKPYVNPWLHFKQSIIHKEYLLHLYELFKNYCPSAPKLKIEAADKRNGKVYSSMYFQTYSLPCLMELHNLFYLEGKKIIPSNIGDLLTPLGLAYLICDDGSWCKQGRKVILCTESFTLEDVNLLLNVLNDKFNLKCYINKKGTGHNGYRIIIPSYSIPVLQNLLALHMPSMMKHKIGL
jgi:hypothetical protein